MAKKKNFWYVLVFTDTGAKFVTRVDNIEKICYWDAEGKPKQMIDKEDALFTASALSFNGNYAMAVVTGYELESQPYRYGIGHFEWVSTDKTE